MRVALVIPAAGSGERLGRGVPKALVDCGGAPLVARTLARLAEATAFTRTVVLAPPDFLRDFEEAVAKAPAALGPVTVRAGGTTRQESVALGVAALGDDVDVVCVHDAARPLVDPATVRGVLEAARDSGAATAAARPSDSVRADGPDGATTPLDRSRLWLVETPQAFRLGLLARAHREAWRRGAAYTDDASLVEADGHEVRIVESRGRNLKVTVESDLVFAAEILGDPAGHPLASEKRFSSTMIESMPGIVYFYDDELRFLRWNRNFEKVSGCSAEEVARMQPGDFFRGDDRGRVAERIAEVFSAGEATVEADFVAKDGTATPYFLTGRRVLFEGRWCLLGMGIDISARRRAEAALVESERKYRELVERANSIILRWSTDGRVLFLNEFGQRFFGWRTEEIVGRHVTETIVPPTESGGRDLRKMIEDILAAPGEFENNANENVRRSGERVWIAWTNHIVRDSEGRAIEILSIGSDVTARHRAETRLRESEAHLAEAQRIARLGSWEYDIARNRIVWSDQIHEIFGLPRDVSASRLEAFLAIVHPEDRERLEQAQRAALDGTGRLDLEHRIVLADGTEKVVHEVADLQRDAQGRPVALAGIVHDITDRVRAQAERERRERAEAADRLKSAFLATMSHELRTPLNSILGFTGIVLQGLAGPLTTEQQKQLGMVRHSARHLLDLINDVLDISKIEAGEFQARIETFDPGASIEAVIALVRPLADAKGLVLAVEAPAALPAMTSDRRRVEQVLLNLLNNAVKFTREGEVRLVAEAVDDGSAGRVRLRVRDTGMGIKPDDLEALFRPFRQLDTGLARHHEGTGLGLAICRRLVELLGGSISVESQWQRGSEFRVELPVVAPGAVAGSGAASSG